MRWRYKTVRGQSTYHLPPDCRIDEINENRLLDILLDAFAAQKEKIEALRGENAHERQCMRSERQLLQAEFQRMRRDPLYCAMGEYRFVGEKGAIFHVHVQGTEINMYKRHNSIDYAMQQVPLT